MEINPACYGWLADKHGNPTVKCLHTGSTDASLVQEIKFGSVKLAGFEQKEPDTKMVKLIKIGSPYFAFRIH